MEFNPLYLLSAALVLGGAQLLSRGLADGHDVESSVGVAALAELYAASLLGGAALLHRIGLRRPAVMLGLLVVLYQWDLTLHAETSVYLGGVGALSLAVWFALFLAKLWALSWALRLKLSRRFLGTFVLGALGLALGPRLLPLLAPRAAGAALAVWAFGLVASIDLDGVTSLVDLDAWGRTVLRRSTRASLALSAVLLALHVASWASERDLGVGLLLPMLPILLVRRARTELRAHALAFGTLAASFAISPRGFFIAALLAALALTWRAHTKVTREPGERARLFTAAVVALYLSVWTLGWSGGPWPAHALALDFGFAATLSLLAWRAKARFAVAPLVATGLHFAIETRLLPPPRSRAEWGASAVSLGFALLAGSLLVSYRLRARPLGQRLGPDADEA